MKTRSLITFTQLFALATACVSPAAERDLSKEIDSQTRTSAQIIEFKSSAAGFDTKNYFYVSEHEVVAIDAQFTQATAQASIEHLRKFTQKPITWLIITHPNPDKFNGAEEFLKEGAKIISSAATAAAMPDVHDYKKYFFVNIAKMFSEDDYPALNSVDEVFDDELTLNLKGGDSLQLREFNQAGVSSNQTLVFSARTKSLFVGDLIHHNAHAWLEGGIVEGNAKPALKSWKHVLERLPAYYPKHTTIYAGRGQSSQLEQATIKQIRYLQKAEGIVRNYIKSLGERRSELQSDAAASHYSALAKEIAKAFPDYQLKYMIEFGVYGLVNQILAE